jgi:general stress protein 26
MKNQEIDKREHLVELLRDFHTGMLVTMGQEGPHARPMALAEVRDDATVTFSTSIGTAKVDEIARDATVLVTLQGKMKFVSLRGRATIDRDRSRIHRLWKEDWRIWYPGGKDDPQIALITVDPEAAEYWDNAGIKGAKFLYRAAKAYLQRTTPDTNGGQNAKVRL